MGMSIISKEGVKYKRTKMISHYTYNYNSYVNISNQLIIYKKLHDRPQGPFKTLR